MLDERQTVAAKVLAKGKSVEDAAKAAGRKPPTVDKWLEEPEFQAAVIRGIRGLAILVLAQYLKHGDNPKAGQAALATLKWLGAGGKTKDRRSPKEPPVEDETDLDEFSEEQLSRLRGEE